MSNLLSMTSVRPAFESMNNALVKMICPSCFVNICSLNGWNLYIKNILTNAWANVLK